MTRRALAGKPLQGSTHAAMKRVAAIHRPVVSRIARTQPRGHTAQRLTRATRTLAGSHPSEPGSGESHGSIVPLALGIGALAAAGGGAWWWWHRHRNGAPPR
jgi:hypothetical protein